MGFLNQDAAKAAFADAAAAERKEKFQNAADAYVRAGEILRDRGSIEEAADACREAIRVAPKWLVGHELLVDLLEKLEDKAAFKEALAELVKRYREAGRYGPADAARARLDALG